MSLKALRIKNDLTQAELGEQMGVTQQYICMLELGQASMPEGFAEKLQERFNLTQAEAAEIKKHTPHPRDRRARRGPYIGAGAKKQHPLS